MQISFKISLIVILILCVLSMLTRRRSIRVYSTRLLPQENKEGFDDYDAADSALRAPPPTQVHKKDIEVAIPHDTDPAMKSLIVNAHQLHAQQQTQAYFDNEIDVQGVLGDTSCESTGSPYMIPPDPHCFEVHHGEETSPEDDEPTIASSPDMNTIINTQSPFDAH